MDDEPGHAFCCPRVDNESTESPPHDRLVEEGGLLNNFPDPK